MGSEGGTPPPAAAAGGIAGTGIAVLADISVHNQQQVAPPPPPEAPGAYKKKSGENSGVLKMIDLLVQDLDKEMAAKRTADSALLTEKTAAKANMEGELQNAKETHASLTKDLGATLKYIAGLHAECD